MAQHLSVITEPLVKEEPTVTHVSRVRFSSRRAYAQTFAASAAIRCLGVASGVLAARLLGPAGRGELAVIIFLPMLLVPLCELELPRSLAYEVSRVDEVPPAVIATSFWLAAGLGFLSALLLAGLLPLYLPADKLHLLAASRWFMIYFPATYITATLMGSDQGQGRFGRFSVLLALPGSLYLVVILTGWVMGRITPSIFALGLLVATLLTTTLRVSMDWRAILRSRPDSVIARRLLKRGVTFYLPTIAGFVLSRADMFILVRLAPMSAVGLYVIAQAIASGQFGAVSPFVHVSFAAVAGETECEAALFALARHFRLAQLASVAAALIAGGLTPWAIRFFFGSGFLAAVTTTYLLIGASALWGMSQVMEQGLRAAGHPRPGIASNLLGLIALAGLGIQGCAHHGIVGLAAATLAAQLLNLAILISFCALELKMPLHSLSAFDGGSLRELHGVAALLIGRIYTKSGRDGLRALP
jgi:O-antigen/teichoic acid export membrane protein